MPLIEVNDLSVNFDGEVVFNGYNNEFKSGQFYGILGRSGRGKTTLLRAIAGLLEPNEGTILYNDKKIKGPVDDIFMMHQNYTNFPWKTCLENILFPIEVNGNIGDSDIKRAKKMLEKVDLEGCENKYPHELSGGMNQRLALARTLLTKPDVILMDEPLSALDDKTRHQMQQLVLNLHRETKNTIIMVTHDPREAKRMSDKIIKL
jgi:ABC-type nitrate/sulfonate/bicarbonate transport system ATPase subunit